MPLVAAVAIPTVPVAVPTVAIAITTIPVAIAVSVPTVAIAVSVPTTIAVPPIAISTIAVSTVAIAVPVATAIAVAATIAVTATIAVAAAIAVAISFAGISIGPVAVPVPGPVAIAGNLRLQFLFVLRRLAHQVAHGHARRQGPLGLEQGCGARHGRNPGPVIRQRGAQHRHRWAGDVQRERRPRYLSEYPGSRRDGKGAITRVARVAAAQLSKLRLRGPAQARDGLGECTGGCRPGHRKRCR